MSRREFGLSRKTKTRQPLTRFVVFAEGRNTEPAYFSALADTLSRVLVKVEILGGEGDPKTLAAKAINFMKGQGRRRRDLSSFEENDQIWVVFDRDTHDKVKETIDNSRKSGVNVAYSNPCFELWLILHFEEFNKSYDHHQIQGHFAKLCPTYSAKGDKKPDCSAFVGQVERAEERARAIRSKRELEGGAMSPPFTDVDKLTSALRMANRST